MNYYQAGSSCQECPTDSTNQYIMFSFVLLLMLNGLWRVTAIKGGQAKDQDAAEGAKGKKDEAEEISGGVGAVAQQMSNSAIMAGIALNQLQLSFMTVRVPNTQ